MKRLFLAILASPLMAAVLTGAAAAQGGIEVTAQEVVNNFPQEVVFRLSAHSEATIQAVTLRYEILTDGVKTHGQPDFTPSERIQVDFHLKGNDPPRSYLAPGTRIDYYWEMEDAAGNSLRTETATFVYDDIRFSWESASEGNVTVYWYAGSRSAAEASLGVARQTLDDTSALLGATVDFPVKVFIYDSYQDMRPALPRRSEAHAREVITAGERVASDTVLILADSSGDILRHELAHVVTKVAGEGPYGGIPAWLDEGTAMYAQSEPGEGFTAPLEGAIRRDSLLSLRSMTAPTGDPSKVNLFYGQAWSVVNFLVESYGREKFAELFAIFKEGSTADDALLKVYGFDQDGLEEAWRASLGLPPQQRATPAPIPSPTPTRAQPSPTPAGSQEKASEDEFPWGTAIALAAAGLGLVGVSLLGVGVLAGRLRQR